MALLITTILATNSTDTPHPHILIASDNTPAVTWAAKGSTTSIKAPAFLLHSLATYRRATPFTFKPVFTPGHTNKIADCCSRSFALSDAASLHNMNKTFPVQPSWKLAQLPSELMSTMNSCALGKLPDVALINNVKMPTTPPGKYGCSSVSASTATQTLQTLPIQYPFCKYLPSVTDSGPLLPVGLQSALERWNKPFVPWARRSPHWDALTPGYPSREKLDFRLSRQLSAYSKEDPPPSRVKPIPLPVIGYTEDMCRLTNTAYSHALADMLLLGFYFLLCPGEYAFTNNLEASPFPLCDVHLLINTRRLDVLTAPEPDLQQANFIALEFTTRRMESP
jgi:hypothetical protein